MAISKCLFPPASENKIYMSEFFGSHQAAKLQSAKAGLQT